MVGVTSKGQEFYFDKEDYERVSQHTWSNNGKGYIMTGVYNKDSGRVIGLRLHRLIMNVSYSKTFVDHINHNPLDNRKSNLRVCSRAENNRNQSVNVNNTSGFKGVHWHNVTNKWVARIRINGKLKHLGYFTNKLEAAKAYNKAASFYFGEFAYLNKIPA